MKGMEDDVRDDGNNSCEIISTYLNWTEMVA